MRVLSYVLPIYRCSFDLYEIKFFPVGVAMEYSLCFKIFIPSTDRVRISDTVILFRHGILNIPIPSKDEILFSAIDDLRTTL